MNTQDNTPTGPTDLNADLKAWLTRHGLAQYFDAMVSEDIGMGTLVQLSNDDLRELGFSIGHRKTFQDALASQQGDATATADSMASERRQMTVLFCDLVGSTELAATLDAEDMADLLERYHALCARIITAWGGLALGSAGDGIVACFGYPRAHENDAERGVSAGLEIARRVAQMSFGSDVSLPSPMGAARHTRVGVALQTRIGIATGRVVVRGRVVDSSSIVGETLNFASRLQDAAPPGGVVVGATTRRLIERIADLSFLGAQTLRGFAEPSDIWLVNKLRDLLDRAETGAPVEDAALLGREDEIAQLVALWDRTRAGQGQVAIVTGEPGIGKSHLMAALRARLADRGVENTIRYFCAPFYENSAYYPIRSHIQRAAGVDEGEAAATSIAKLEALFPHETDRALPLIADLLSIDPGAAYPALDMTPTQRKNETFAVLLEQFLQLSRQGPVLAVVEDAHWVDPTSREFLTRVMETIPGHPIMLLVMHRPDTDLGWNDQPHVSALRLRRLNEDKTRAIITRIADGRVLPEEIIRKICENADGVPLFAEELTRSVIEQSDRADLSSVKVPVTLEDSLMERLDRLTIGKPLIDTASVIGRRFTNSLLREMLAVDEAAYAMSIREPLDAKILAEETGGHAETVQFRHALIQQAAYEGVLRSKRRALHARIAELLIRDHPMLAETEPETLARHYAGAGQPDVAIKYLVAAGKQAASRAAQVEAINHYNTAIELLNEMPPSRERDHEEVLLRALLGGALMSTRGFAAPEVHDSFARARELCIELGDSPIYCLCLYGLFTVEASRSNRETAMALADEILDTFGASPVPSWAIAAQFSNGVSSLFQGKFPEAQGFFEAAVALYTEDQHVPMVEQFHDNLGEFSICYLHWLSLIQGDVDASGVYLSRVQAMADGLNNKNAQVRSISFQMGREQQLGNVDAVAELAPRAMEISTRQGYPYWACAGQIGLGWAMAHRGDADGIAHIEQGLAFFDMIGQRLPQAYWRSYLVDSLIALDRRDAALEAAEGALALTRSGLERFYEADILRLKAKALQMVPAGRDAARDCLHDALALAATSRAGYFQFQSSLALAQLLAEDGETDAAREMLDKGLARIASSTSFPELEQARKLLSSLS